MNHYIKRIPAIFVLGLFLLQVWAGTASAIEQFRLQPMSPPLHQYPMIVTSPWGESNHGSPPHIHKGIDFATDVGEPIYAVADGTVAIAGYDPSFDGWVVINHTDNWSSWYGDISSSNIPVYPGETVTAGQVIGYGGTMGGSHLHFEVRIGLNGQGESLNPWAYAPYAPWLPKDSVDPSMRHNTDMQWNPGADFTGAIKKAIDTVAEACTKALDLLRGIIIAVISILMVIDLSISMMMYSLEGQTNQPGASFLKLLILKCLLYAFLFFFITNFSSWIANGTRDLFLGMGADATGTGIDKAKSMVADPFSIVTKGAKLVQPLFFVMNDANSGLLSTDIFAQIGLGIGALFFFFIIFGCFTLFAIQVAITYLEFYMVMVFSFSTFMFAGWQRLRTYAANGISGIFAVSIKLMFFSIFVMMMHGIVDTIQVDDIVTKKDTDWVSVSAHPNGDFKSIEDLAAAILIVETGGRSDAYVTPSSDGYGYGAWQLSYDLFPGWYNDAYGEGAWDSFEPKWPWDLDPAEGKESPWVAFTSDGIPSRAIPYNGDWHDIPALAPQHPWPPSVQDQVAITHLKNLYAKYGNYQDVAWHWNGTGRPRDEYWGKVCQAAGTMKKNMYTLNLVPLLKLTLFCLFFVFVGDRMSSTIIQQFGRGGFTFTGK